MKSQPSTIDSQSPNRPLIHLERVTWLATILTGAILAMGAILQGLWGLAIASGGLTAAALIAGVSPHTGFLIDVFFVGSATVLVLGILQGVPIGLGVCVVGGTLAAWDLFHFQRRLHSAAKAVKPSTLISQHISRLILVDAGGVVLALVAISLQVTLDLGAVLALIAVLMIGIGQIISVVRQESD